MKKSIYIEFKDNGYLVTSKEFLKGNGQNVYRFTEELKLLEALGMLILEKKVEVKER